jgi:predicted nucleic acid-binding protein
MILVDSNVPMYLVGADHPHRVDARRVLERLRGDRLPRRRLEHAAELLACVSAATKASLRSPMSVCFYRYYRGAVRAALDAQTVARARRAGAQLSVDAALAAELQGDRP